MLTSTTIATVDAASADGVEETTFKSSCAMCHGADGSGDTAVGKSMKIPDLHSRYLSSSLARSLVPIEETAEAMHQLYKQGKIRAIGASNYSLEQMSVFQHVAPLHTAQPPYNLFERGVKKDVLPYCLTHGVSTLRTAPCAAVC